MNFFHFYSFRLAQTRICSCYLLYDLGFPIYPHYKYGQIGLILCAGPIMKAGVRLPSISAYMYDLTITTSSVTVDMCILRTLEKLIAWA